MSARTRFEHEMGVLKLDLIEMGRLIEQAIEDVVLAFKNQDHNLAREIIKGDSAVNDMQHTIESRCLALILRQQPVARDLRIVSTALKVVTDMERIGDQAADIAEILLHMEGENIFKESIHIPEMAKISKEMVHDAIEAFAKEDLEAARLIAGRDDLVDELFCKVKEDVLEMFRSGAEISDHGIDLLMIGKYLERVGDHAQNICEWIEFCQKGTVNSVKIL